jgi:hypothetical protein
MALENQVLACVEIVELLLTISTLFHGHGPSSSVTPTSDCTARSLRLSEQGWYSELDLAIRDRSRGVLLMGRLITLNFMPAQIQA